MALRVVNVGVIVDEDSTFSAVLLKYIQAQ